MLLECDLKGKLYCLRRGGSLVGVSSVLRAGEERNKALKELNLQSTGFFVCVRHWGFMLVSCLLGTVEKRAPLVVLSCVDAYGEGALVIQIVHSGVAS